MAPVQSIGVLTSGGDSPGMNAGIRAVVRAALAYDLTVFGIEHGFQGLIDQHLRPMSSRDVSGIINQGGTILKSARCKAFFEPEGRKTAADTLKEHRIDALVAIGGEGTYRGLELLAEEHGVRVIGMPGTIDNDIGGTDLTIGFDTALNTAVEAIDRLRDTAQSHDRLFFVEVMGRHSGYLAMLSAIAGGAEQVLVPETPTDIPGLIQKLNQFRMAGKTSYIVIVAEGDEAGDAAEISRKVLELTEFADSRVAVIGHLQRGGRPTASDRILASRFGVHAVQALVDGESGVMTAINGSQVKSRPLADSHEVKSSFDPAYAKLAEILAT